jgi:pentatricopeptide repeat protein
MPAYIDLGAAYIEKKMYPEAIAALDQGLSVERDNTFAMSALVYAYAASGKRDEALKVLDRMKELSSQRYVAPTHLASAYAGLGEKEQAFQLLEKAYEQHDDGLIYLKVATQFDSLRSDPRFADLVRRVGLPS